jgi:selenocysteine lyase/cysteine desulfurase
MAQKRFGADVARVPLRDGVTVPEDYEAALDQRTLVVSACHGYYQNGFKQDILAIAELAHERGALLYVDAYQTLGTAPFDAPSSGADFVAAGCLKYLMGTPGIAFVWVRPGLAERLRPALTGWFGRREPFAFDAERLDWAEGARRLASARGPAIRLAPHFYSSVEDVDRALDALAEVLGGGGA